MASYYLTIISLPALTILPPLRVAECTGYKHGLWSQVAQVQIAPKHCHGFRFLGTRLWIRVWSRGDLLGSAPNILVSTTTEGKGNKQVWAEGDVQRQCNLNEGLSQPLRIPKLRRTFRIILRGNEEIRLCIPVLINHWFGLAQKEGMALGLMALFSQGHSQKSLTVTGCVQAHAQQLGVQVSHSWRGSEQHSTTSPWALTSDVTLRKSHRIFI